MFIIFPETHKIIAQNIQKAMVDKYDIELNEARTVWGSISPDFLPKYKVYRHYLDDSINFVVNEIVNLIYIAQFFDLTNMTRFQRKVVSNKVGVISHFLSDYVCLPHAERWTFNGNFRVHVAYERELSLRAPNHTFTEGVITTPDINIDEYERVLLKNIVKEYIIDVVEEYGEKKSYERDLDFALDFNTKVFGFCFETATALYRERNMVSSFVF